MAVLGEKIARFANGTYHIDQSGTGFSPDGGGNAMIGVVKSGTDQFVHSRVHDIKGLFSAIFDVSHPGQKDPRVSGNESSGFQNQIHVQSFYGWNDFNGVLGRGWGLFTMIINPIASAQIDRLDRETLTPKRKTRFSRILAAFDTDPVWVI